MNMLEMRHPLALLFVQKDPPEANAMSRNVPMTENTDHMLVLPTLHELFPIKR